MDIDSYLARIGYGGPRAPTLETLRALSALHPAAIPFENLDVLMRRPIRLDIDALTEKLVHAGRGGYCFEHNALFQAALAALGFDVRAVAARAYWRYPDGAANPRSHMALIVDLPEGEHLADVGFGSLSLTGPLRLATDSVQETPHGRFRIVPAGAEIRLEAETGEGFLPVYQLSTHEQVAADWAVLSWYVSTFPQSRFVTSLIAARQVADRRYGLLNDTLATHHRDGRSERQVLRTADEIEDALRGLFGISVPDGFRAVLEARLAGWRVAER